MACMHAGSTTPPPSISQPQADLGEICDAHPCPARAGKALELGCCTAAHRPPPPPPRGRRHPLLLSICTPPCAMMKSMQRDSQHDPFFSAYCQSALPIMRALVALSSPHPHSPVAPATHPALAVGSTTLSGFTLVDGTPEGRPILRMTSDYLEESPIHSPSKHPSPSSLPCMLCHAPAHPPVTLPSLH